MAKLASTTYVGVTEGKITKEAIAELLKAEFTKIQAAPPEEQARMIGMIAGNIIGTLGGGKAFKGALGSDFLRTSYKPIE